MATGSNIDSNVTGLRYSEETSLGVANGSAVWYPLEPNEYADFGGEVVTVARNPINAGRQNKKGVVVDLNASGGFNTDLTSTNVQDIMQGFLWADFRRKGEEAVTAATGTTDLFSVALTAGFLVNDLIWASGFDNAANNGLHVVTAVNTDTSIEVLGSSLVTETPSGSPTIVNVGHQFAAGDLDVVDGTPGSYTAATKDLTQLGLIPGEWIYVGGDSASLAFTAAENNGFKRVKSITSGTLVIDKSDTSLSNESSTTETIQLFYGRVLKNESDPANQVCRSYQLERTLGDDGSGTQSEYLVGSLCNEAVFNMSTADKITVDLGFVSTDHETRDGTTGVKAGSSRPALVEEDAFNTTSDFSRFKMATVSASEEAPTPLFAFLTEATLTVSNGVTPTKAIANLGSIGASTTNFTVSGQLTAYFADTTATAAVRNNADVTLDFTMAKGNTGITVDLPLITLGDGRVNVSQNEKITLPLSLEAATGAKVDSNMDHTMLMVFWDYLPTAAEA